jgi:PAS domain S-box-containing protein
MPARRSCPRSADTCLLAAAGQFFCHSVSVSDSCRSGVTGRQLAVLGRSLAARNGVFGLLLCAAALLVRDQRSAESASGRCLLTAATVISGLASRLHKARQDSYADMASRSHVEEALRHSEQQWRDVLENNPIMYFMVDARGTIMAVNPFRAEQLGHKVDELVGQPVLKLFFDADREAAQSRVAQCLQRLGQSMNWELRKRACVRHKPTSHVSAG